MIRNDKPYPENLLTAFGFVELFWGGVYTPISDDQATGLEYVLTTLTERERTIIRERFEEYKTYKIIAAEYHVSIERIRAILHKAKRKMRLPEMAVYIVNGLQDFRQMKREKEEKDRIRVEEIVSAAERKSRILDIGSMQVSNMGLSKRITNPLEYAGVKTFYDLVEIIVNRPQDFFLIYGIGPVLRKKIFEKLREYGVEPDLKK